MADTFVDKLVAILVKNHVVSEQEGQIYCEQFHDSDHDSFDEFLIEEGLVSKEDLLGALSTYYQLPALDATGYLFDSELVRNFPKDFLLRNEIIPVELEEEILVVAAAHPDDEVLLSNIGNFVDTDIQFNVGLARDITDAVKEFYDKSPTEEPEDLDLDQERKEQEEFERDGQLHEDED